VEPSIRKHVALLEEVHREGDADVTPPTRVGAAAAVVANPLAGAPWSADLEPLIDAYSRLLGELLAARCRSLLDGPVEAYGKGALVGTGGEIEHGSAIIHTLVFGNPIRDPIDATTLLPSVEKRGAPGAAMDIPLKHIHDATTRSHHQSFELRIPDAPGPDEIVVAVAMASSGRPNARIGNFGAELRTA
jgi:hypothetical protein